MQPLLIDFLRVTEKAALSTLPFIGGGDQNAADNAATKAMRKQLNRIQMNGSVVIGEGEIDDAPMLYIGEHLGAGNGPDIDIAVDPIEGTTSVIKGENNAITVIAAAPRGTLLHAPDMYMEKIAVGPEAAGKINIEAPLIENIKAVAAAKKKTISDVKIMVQDRPRHQAIIDTVRASGAKVHLFNDGDVIYAMSTCIEHLDLDMLVGIGGAPEGVLAAVALKALGGEIQSRLKPRTELERNRCVAMGMTSPENALLHDQMVQSDKCIFAATGITNTLFLNGIRTSKDKWVTHSVLINGQDEKMRFIESRYDKSTLLVCQGKNK